MKTITMELQNNVYVFTSAGALALAGANIVLNAARAAIKARDKFVIALSGGNTPKQLYSLLATPPFKNEMPWNKTFVFWGDERCEPADSDENNSHSAKVLFLDKVNIPESNIYPVCVSLKPKKAAEVYANRIASFFRPSTPQFDLILLGLGENGHTASLFPNSNMVFKPEEIVKEVYVTELKKYRITMTPALINQARQILFLVEGENKAGILNSVLTSDFKPDQFLAQLIKPVNSNLDWFTDKYAASLLPVEYRANCINVPA